MQVYFRQDQARLNGPDGEGVSATVAGVVQRGATVRVDLQALGLPVELLLPPGEVPDYAAPGRPVRIAPRAVRIFPTGRAG